MTSEFGGMFGVANLLTKLVVPRDPKQYILDPNRTVWRVWAVVELKRVYKNFSLHKNLQPQNFQQINSLKLLP